LPIIEQKTIILRFIFQMNDFKVIGYIRVSTEKQDLEKQRHLLLEYANQHQMLIDEFIEVEMSSQRDRKERRIDDLLERLKEESILMVAELSRLGRNMLETLNIINELNEKGIKVIFVRQPELSTYGAHSKLLLAIYSYFAEAEREYISIRTKQGLMVAKAKGKLLGRPKGSKNKKGRVLDPYKEQIKSYLNMGLTINAVLKIINNQLQEAISYNSLKYYIEHDGELKQLRIKRGYSDDKKKDS
jgi:DNA invertase Pin-like site-specific DNA recombinase